MATYIKTLKEDNGDIVYPQTITDAIYTSGGQTLETRISQYVTAEDIASSVASFGTVTTGMIDDDAITTAKIDDAAVTSDKIDFTTIGNNFVEDDGQNSISITTSLSTISTITGLPAGTYLVAFDGAFHHADNTTRNIFIQYTPSSGTNSYQSLCNLLQQSVAYWNHCSTIAKCVLTSSGSIAIQIKGETSFTATLYHGRAYAIRIS